MKVYLINTIKDINLTTQEEHLGLLDIEISHPIIKNLLVQVESQIMVLKDLNSVEVPVMIIQLILIIASKLSKKKIFHLKSLIIIKR